MIKISGIYTIRDISQPHYWDIVFEWEDQFSKSLNVPLVLVGKRYEQIYRPNALRKLFNRVNAYRLIDWFFYTPQNFYIAFHIGPPGVYSFHARSNVIPIIIDFWKHENIKRMESIFRYSQAVFVSSKEAFEYLQSVNIKIKLKHLSLSLPDKYLLQDNFEERDIDIIQIGRSNATLDGYMRQFLKDHPDVHYVHAKKMGDEVRIISSKSFSFKYVEKRKDFMRLLKRSKISLVSAPGLDGDCKRTGGFAPVTPRFLESAACGCNLLGIYPQNADFQYYDIKSICISIKSYDQFKRLACDYLQDKTVPDFTEFLTSHLSSKRAIELMNKLQINE